MGVRGSAGVRVHQQHEFDVAGCEEGVNVVILVGVDFLQVSTPNKSALVLR